jgi:mannose-6-phosphate isomerase-like protein (cupin superfamily)
MTPTPDNTERGVRIYRAADAPELHESGAATSDFEGNEELRDTASTLASSECSSSRLLVHQDRDEGGLSVVYLFFKPNFPLFRHKHDVNSLYVVVSGSAVGFMGNETLLPGDCFAVSAQTPYYYTAGPDGVEVLEIFRDADTVTVIYTDNPDGRLEEAQEAVRANADAWATITSGPLYRANAEHVRAHSS